MGCGPLQCRVYTQDKMFYLFLPQCSEQERYRVWHNTDQLRNLLWVDLVSEKQMLVVMMA